MSHNRARGTCPTCKRKKVTLMSKAPDAQCSVCTRVEGVAAKILANKPITPTDHSTIRRVLAHHQQGDGGSIETSVAESKGYISLFEGLGNVPEWPRMTQAWACSDGTLHHDEAAALRVELTLTRNRRAA